LLFDEKIFLKILDEEKGNYMLKLKFLKGKSYLEEDKILDNDYIDEISFSQTN